MGSLHVVIAPDSFKGTMTAREAGEAIAEGWRMVRPQDHVTILPMADGGEGTLDILHQATPASRVISVGDVTGPDGRPQPSHFLALDDTTAVVELAVASGITQMDSLDALGATTRGLGETIHHAITQGFANIVVALGGSASTDAGLGALQALGLAVSTHTGEPLPPGGGHVGEIVSFDASGLTRPSGSVTILRDTTATFLDAPSMFGPQKGAAPDDVELLSRGFRHLLEVTGDDSVYLEPGSGAAGGTGWGLGFFLGATIRDGAAMVAELAGVTSALDDADLIITGEGKFDATSLTGKVTGQIITLAKAHNVPVAIVAGVVDDTIAGTLTTSSLVDAAGSADQALSDPTRWAREASRMLAVESAISTI
jgi:glycerate 2-kinase